MLLFPKKRGSFTALLPRKEVIFFLVDDKKTGMKSFLRY